MAYKCGIYCIQNSINGKRYIGSSTRIQKRKKNHFYALRRNTHWNAHLQAAFNKYGQSSFVLTILEECATEVLIQREQFWLDYHNAADPSVGYNLNGFANLFHHTEDSKRKSSESNKQRYREGRVPFLLGKTHSPEVKAYLSALNKGKVVSEATRAKQGAARIGMKLSEEHKRKIGDAFRGRKQPQWAIEKRIKSANYCKPIMQLEIDGVTLIARHGGITIAATSVGISSQGIIDCAKRRRLSFKGYIWRYAE